MANHTDDDGKPRERFVRLDDGEMHVVEDGRPSAPAVLLIHGTAGSTAWWDPIVPELAEACRVIRVDLLGHGRSSTPDGGFDIPTQARRVGAALDTLGVRRATVVGHSAGCMVATALGEQRPRAVAALALIDMGPSLEAKFPDGLLARLLFTRLPGRLLWSLRTGATTRKAMRTAFTRPVDIPDGIIEAAKGMTHRALTGAARASRDYLGERSLPARLAALGIPVLVISAPTTSDGGPRRLPRTTPCLTSASSFYLASGTPRCSRTRKQPARCCSTSPRPIARPPAASHDHWRVTSTAVSHPSPRPRLGPRVRRAAAPCRPTTNPAIIRSPEAALALPRPCHQPWPRGQDRRPLVTAT